jgi:hypothetical protein
MKDIIIGLLLGFTVGVTSYYLVDGIQNKAARAAAAQQQSQVQGQLGMLQQMCPEVLKKVEQKK